MLNSNNHNLNGYSKPDLILMITALNNRLADVNMKFGQNRAIIGEQANTISAQRKALRRSMATVRSLRQTVKRRRKHRGKNN